MPHFPKAYRRGKPADAAAANSDTQFRHVDILPLSLTHGSPDLNSQSVLTRRQRGVTCWG
jgi:hypothetical protein